MTGKVGLQLKAVELDIPETAPSFIKLIPFVELLWKLPSNEICNFSVCVYCGNFFVALWQLYGRHYSPLLIGFWFRRHDWSEDAFFFQIWLGTFDYLDILSMLVILDFQLDPPSYAKSSTRLRFGHLCTSFFDFDLIFGMLGSSLTQPWSQIPKMNFLSCSSCGHDWGSQLRWAFFALLLTWLHCPCLLGLIPPVRFKFWVSDPV